MTIGERIKKRREELGMTQEELAKLCGYKSRSSINKLELSRDLPLKKIRLMADALQTTPSDLMGWFEDIEELENQAKKDLSNLIDFDSNSDGERQLRLARTVDRYLNFIKSDGVLYEPEDDFRIEKMNKALELYEKIEKADPNIREAILSLLKGVQ